MSEGAPFSVGPYRIERTLGKGGIGVVYEAVHGETGGRVALKTVRLPETSMLASIRREVYALQRLAHPGVVRVIDQGVDPDLGPWYAMERIDGASLRERFEAWNEARGEGALTTERRTEIASVFHAICEALAVVHASGVVHRDLKPENVMLARDGRVVLVDFGLASEFGVLDRVGYARSNGGTLRYLAPELLEGDEADARADLYALGCMLFESVAGRAPFEGASRRELLEQLRGEAPPLSTQVDGVSAAFDDLVRQMLARRPEDRVGHASDVARALRSLGARATASPTAPAVSAYLYRSALVGRAKAIERIESATWRSERGDGFALVVGEGGVGKTRVLVDVASRMQRARMRVIEGGAEHRAAGRSASRAAAPLSTFRPFLRWVADQCREDPARFEDDLLTPWGSVLSRYEASFEGLVPASRAGLARAATTQRAVLDAMRAAIEVCATGASFALVLDDLQWADELSIALVSSLSRAHDRPDGLTVVAASRADELPATLDAPDVCRIDLARLELDDVASLLRGLLALRDVPAELADFVFARSEGNPFFAAEYVRAAIAEGHLRRDDAGRWYLAPGARGEALERSVSAPAAVSEVVRWRLADLSPDASLTLAAAAVLGREPHGEVLASVAALPEGSLLEALDELRRRQVLEPSRDGRLRFAHDLLRETASRSLDRDRARALERRAAEACEAHPSTRDDVESIGMHWSRASVDDRAAQRLTQAADAARSAFANRRAIDLYALAREHCLAAFEATTDAAWRSLAASLDERRGEVLERIASHDEARDAFARALAARDEADHTARARLKLRVAKTWEATHRHDVARDGYDAAAAELEATPDDARDEAWWSERVEVQVERVWLHYWLGEVDAITALVERARPLVLTHGSARQRARFYQAIVHHDLRRLRYRLGEETVRASRSSLEAAYESGDLGSIAYARFIVGFASLFAGAHDEAERDTREALSEALRAGDAVLSLRCRTYLTVALRSLGRVDDAEREAKASLDASRAMRMRDYEGVARANFAWVAQRRGDVEATTREAALATEIWRELAARFVYPMEWLARLPAMAAAFEAGRADEALEHAAKVLERGQHDLPGEALSHCRAALEAQSRDDARGVEDALRHALTSAARARLL